MGCNLSSPTSTATRAHASTPTSSVSSSELRHLEVMYSQLQTKNSEQQNLLRFKIEVLVNMLAVEEKKNQALMERYEVLRYELLEKGVDEDKLTSLFRDAVQSVGGTSMSLKANDQEQIYQTIERARSDLSAAIAHVQDEFSLYKTDIITALADEQGRFDPTLRHLDFMKRLYMATDHISRDDIEIIALRFSDGQGSVLVPEFIDFFTSPVHVRMARSAASAARMSLDMLVLDREAFFADDDMLLSTVGTGGTTSCDSVVQTHATNYLDSGASKLISVWPYVEKDLLEHYRSQLESVESPVEDDGTTGLLPCDVFKILILDFCGEQTKSQLLAANRSNAAAVVDGTAVVPLATLDASDVDLISERFEVSGVVNFQHFFQYFTQLYHYQRVMNRRRTEQGLSHLPTNGLSPFRISSEWKSLMKVSAIKQYSNKQHDTPKQSSSAGNQLGKPHLSPEVSDPSQKPTKPPKVQKAVDNANESSSTKGPTTDQNQLPSTTAPIVQSSALCCGVNKKIPSTTKAIPPAVTAPNSDAKPSTVVENDAKASTPVASDAKPSAAVESDAKPSETAAIEGSKAEDSTNNVKRKVEFEEVPTVKKYREYDDEAVSESKADGRRQETSQTKGLRSELDDALSAFDVESISDIDSSHSIQAPKSSASPMKKASAFKKPKQSLLDESSILGAGRSAVQQFDDEEEVPTRWKK